MNWNRFIFWLCTFLMAFALFTIAGTVTYFKRPNWLGIQNELADSLNRVNAAEMANKMAIEKAKQLKKDTTKRNPIPLINVSIDTLIEISPEQLNFFERELYNKSEQILTLKKEKDWTYNNSKKLKDTIKQLNDKITKYNDSIKKYQSQTKTVQTDDKKVANEIASWQKKIDEATEQIKKSQNDLKAKDDKIIQLQEDIKTSANDASSLKKQIQSLQTDIANAKKETTNSNKRFDSLQKAYKDLQDRYEKKKDSLNSVAFNKFAELYNGSKPKEVANIMDNLDPEKAANILNRMQKKKAGKVIEAMDPARAADVLKYTIDF